MAKKKVYTPEFKAKVARELIGGDDSVSVVAARHNLNPAMLSGRRKQFFDNAAIVFSQDQEIERDRQEQAEQQKEVDNLNRIIGRLTVERDCLQRCIEKARNGFDY